MYTQLIARNSRRRRATQSERGQRADDLYEYLRNAILSGALEPRTRLVEQAIAEQARVSRTPVREALHRLETDGLVRSSNRGVTVVDFTDDELYEFCVAREGMEGLAARLAASARTEVNLATLDQIISKSRTATEIGNVEAIVAMNHAFHEAVWQASRNRYLTGQLFLLRGLIERLQPTTLDEPIRQRAALEDHANLVRAMERGDAKDAEAITKNHFRTAMAIRLARQPGRKAADTRLP